MEMMMNGIDNKLLFCDDEGLVEVKDEFAMLSDDESLSRRKSESNTDGEDGGMERGMINVRFEIETGTEHITIPL